MSCGNIRGIPLFAGIAKVRVGILLESLNTYIVPNIVCVSMWFLHL